MFKVSERERRERERERERREGERRKRGRSGMAGLKVNKVLGALDHVTEMSFACSSGFSLLVPFVWKMNGACAHYVMVSKFQWKPFWLATQRDPQNDWTATENRVNYDIFAQAPVMYQYHVKCICFLISKGTPF